MTLVFFLYAAGEAEGLTVAVTVGLALISGEGIAGLSLTTGTFGLAVGVTSTFLQAHKSTVINRTRVIIAAIVFI